MSENSIILSPVTKQRALTSILKRHLFSHPENLDVTETRMRKRDIITTILLCVFTLLYYVFDSEEVFKAIQLAIFTILLLCMFWREKDVALGIVD